LLDRHGKGIVQRLFSGVKVAKQTDQRGKNRTRIRAIDRIHYLAYLVGRVFTHK
jgi:hypothetical protein